MRLGSRMTAAATTGPASGPARLVAPRDREHAALHRRRVRARRSANDLVTQGKTCGGLATHRGDLCADRRGNSIPKLWPPRPVLWVQWKIRPESMTMVWPVIVSVRTS